MASFHAREKAALLEEAARELGFRADFGKNWDAFADALDELAWQERKLLLVFAQSLDSPDELQILLEILAEAFPPRDETPNAQLKVLFRGSKITAFDFDWQPLP